MSADEFGGWVWGKVKNGVMRRDEPHNHVSVRPFPFSRSTGIPFN